MKKIISIASAFIISALMSTGVMAADEIGVVLDGKKLTFDQNPVIKNDRTLVPFRGILEAMGAEVGWDGTTRTVTAKKDDVALTLVIDSNIMYKNGEAITLDVAPQIVNDRTMVPARAVSESFSAKVNWNGSDKLVIISTDELLNKAIENANNADEYHSIQKVSYTMGGITMQETVTEGTDSKNKIVYRSIEVLQNGKKVHENIFIANPDKGYTIQNGEKKENTYNGTWSKSENISTASYYEFVEETETERIYKVDGGYEKMYIDKKTAMPTKKVVSKEDANKISTGETYTEDIVTTIEVNTDYILNMWNQYNK